MKYTAPGNADREGITQFELARPYPDEAAPRPRRELVDLVVHAPAYSRRTANRTFPGVC